MAAASLLSITLVPVMMGLFIRGRIKREAANPVNRALVWLYRPVITFVLRYRWTTVVVAAALLVAPLYPWSRLGSEFMPPLNEGSGVVMLIFLDHAYDESRRSAYDPLGRRRCRRARYRRARATEMMTVTAIMAGLVPIPWSQGAGADMRKRIAAPMVGGMITSTALTLIVIPAVYSLWKERTLPRTGEMS